jgi:HNH endonuclease
VPESLTLVGHEVDHIIAAKHAGGASAENLALCCALCNKYKGTDLASIDPETGELQRLFHPRRDRWYEHFELRGGEILAHTAIGRVTVRLLQLNRRERVRERDTMIQAGLL